MIQDRNLSSHSYNRSTAEAICQSIAITFLACFQKLRQRLQQRRLQEQQ
jgi:hypothetical protein